MKRTYIWLAIGFLFLIYGTVAVFVALDRSSNSASDTLRPFLITMVPVWAITIAGALVLIRARAK